MGLESPDIIVVMMMMLVSSVQVTVYQFHDYLKVYDTHPHSNLGVNGSLGFYFRNVLTRECMHSLFDSF